MARPKSKQELIDLSQNNYKKLLAFIDNLPEEKRTGDFPKGTLNRSIKDVLAHLHEWHLMMLQWHKVGMTGTKPDMPAKGYTWKTLPDLNKKIWEKYRDEEYQDISTKLEESYFQLQELIASYSDEELFEKKRYKWTGSTSLAAYLISNTSSHYDWAYKLIKKSTK